MPLKYLHQDFLPISCARRESNSHAPCGAQAPQACVYPVPPRAHDPGIEPLAGTGPAASALRVRCSTIELKRPDPCLTVLNTKHHGGYRQAGVSHPALGGYQASHSRLRRKENKQKPDGTALHQGFEPRPLGPEPSVTAVRPMENIVARFCGTGLFNGPSLFRARYASPRGRRGGRTLTVQGFESCRSANWRSRPWLMDGAVRRPGNSQR